MSDHEEIDVEFQGRAEAICCHRIGDVIVDPGPETCAATLRSRLGDLRPRAILLTHIHLDHAGAAGTLAREWPETEVWVHERGAPHLLDPSRLIESATRIYGERMGELWGEIAPVPQENLVVLSGGERRDGFSVAYTPGHASHHVSYLHEDSGIALCGDVGGIRFAGMPIIPPTPPPDIDLELWAGSLQALRAWQPSALAITHFGTYADVEHQLDSVREGLAFWGERARHTTAAEFEAEQLAVVGTSRPYTVAMPLSSQHAGLARYWAKRAS